MDTEILKRFMSGELQLLYNFSKKLTTMNLNAGLLMKDLVYMLGELEGVRRVALYVANAAAVAPMAITKTMVQSFIASTFEFILSYSSSGISSRSYTQGICPPLGPLRKSP